MNTLKNYLKSDYFVLLLATAPCMATLPLIAYTSMKGEGVLLQTIFTTIAVLVFLAIISTMVFAGWDSTKQDTDRERKQLLRYKKWEQKYNEVLESDNTAVLDKHEIWCSKPNMTDIVFKHGSIMKAMKKYNIEF